MKIEHYEFIEMLESFFGALSIVKEFQDVKFDLFKAAARPAVPHSFVGVSTQIENFPKTFKYPIVISDDFIFVGSGLDHTELFIVGERAVVPVKYMMLVHKGSASAAQIKNFHLMDEHLRNKSTR